MAMKQKVQSKVETVTATQSTRLVKNLLRAAFGSIAYIRNFFSKDCFETVQMTFSFKRVLDKNPESALYAKWYEQGIFDALERKYLEFVLLQVYAPDSKALTQAPGKSKGPQQKQLLECYTFKVSYHENTVKLSTPGWEANDLDSQYSRRAIRKQASEMVRSLVEKVNSLPPLPKNHLLCIKLLYTPETPQDYEPPLFCKADEEDDFWFTEQALRVNAGKLHTPYHSMSMCIRVQATDANKRVDMFSNRNEKKEVEGTQEVDVGDSQANSGRVVIRSAIRESQDIGEDVTPVSTKCRLRLKKPNTQKTPEGSPAGAQGRQGRKRKMEESPSPLAESPEGKQMKMRKKMSRSKNL